MKTYIHSAVDDEQREEEKNTFKEISKIIEKRENVEIEKMAGMGDIEELQKKIRNIENEIIELKNKEIIRIFKEFIENKNKTINDKKKHMLDFDALFKNIILQEKIKKHENKINKNNKNINKAKLKLLGSKRMRDIYNKNITSKSK